MNDDEGLLVALVETASPTGKETQAVRLLQEQARADGFQVQEDEVGNFIAQAGRGQRLILFVGHVDTVPGEIPVRVEEGVLWGRGSVDAKGSLAAAFCAARRFVEDDRFRVVVVGAVDEEGGSKGARGLTIDGEPEWVINGEPSGAGGLTLAYKGIVRGRFLVEQEMGHGAGPLPSAADRLVEAWNEASKRFSFQRTFDAVHGRLDSLRTHGDGLLDCAEASFQLRVPPGMAVDVVQRSLQTIADAHRLGLEVTEAIPGVQASRRSSLVAAFTSAVRAHGLTPRLLRKTGTSDMNLLSARYPGVPIAAYGPGDSELDHRPDERLSLEEFRRSVDVLDRVFQAFAEGTTPEGRLQVSAHD